MRRPKAVKKQGYERLKDMRFVCVALDIDTQVVQMNSFKLSKYGRETIYYSPMANTWRSAERKAGGKVENVIKFLSNHFK